MGNVTSVPTNFPFSHIIVNLWSQRDFPIDMEIKNITSISNEYSMIELLHDHCTYIDNHNPKFIYVFRHRHARRRAIFLVSTTDENDSQINVLRTLAHVSWMSLLVLPSSESAFSRANSLPFVVGFDPLSDHVECVGSVENSDFMPFPPNYVVWSVVLRARKKIEREFIHYKTQQSVAITLINDGGKRWHQVSMMVGHVKFFKNGRGHRVQANWKMPADIVDDVERTLVNMVPRVEIVK